MKTRNIFFAIVLAIAVLMACSSNDDTYNPTNEIKAVAFNSNVSDMKMSGTSWAAGDKIGVTMVATGTTTVKDNMVNKQYQTTGTVQFTPVTNNEIYYPADNNAVDFHAYYPYTADLTNTYQVNVTNQANQSDIDLLYAKATNKTSSTPSVTLQFSHQLVKIVVDIVKDSNIPSLAGASVHLDGIATTATFDLLKGILAEGTNVTTINALTSTDGERAEAIVLPVNGTSHKVTVKLNNDIYSAVFPDAFVAGHKYAYTLTLNAGGQASLTLTSNITDWTNGGGGNISAVKDGGSGTQISPYTVPTALTKAGQRGVWVEGFIVGSTSKTKALGADSDLNILLAASATETNESKCIIVDLDGSTVKANLGLTTNPTLKGAKVKVKGDIVNTGFSNTVNITAVTEQEGGASVTPPKPSGNLLFAGSDFENWSDFEGSLNSYGLSTGGYASQNATGGRNGSSALYLNGKATKNDYTFTAINKSAIAAGTYTQVNFYIKGTSTSKSLSLNVYTSTADSPAMGTDYKCYNLKNATSDITLNPTAANDYTGAVDTGGQWVKVTLDISSLAINTNTGDNIFALKVGKDGVYDLLIDDITIE